MLSRLKTMLLLALLLLLSACWQSNEESAATNVPPTPTDQPTPTADPALINRPANFVVIATDAPSRAQIFTDINQFGEVVGFDPQVMSRLATAGGFEYEFVVTGFDGLLASVASGEFDAAMGALVIAGEPPEGIVFTDPYLEVGQVLVVLANDDRLTSYQSIPPGVPIGVLENASSEETARTIVGLEDQDIVPYSSAPVALQALIDGDIEGVILDSDDADYYTNAYFQQLKIVGGAGGRSAWISSKAYAIAVAADNPELLARLNEAIAQVQTTGSINELVDTWLVSRDPLIAGESLIGTPFDEVVIGVAGPLTDLDPGAPVPSNMSWEVKRNIMSGLYSYDADSNLVPILVDNYIVAEDGLQYTFTLKSGILFPDGQPLTAEDVRWSILRSARMGNWLVNAFLKDENQDGFADADAVQTLDELSLRIRLQEPVSYFFSLLATPPYYVISQDCFGEGYEPESLCGGIGPYTVAEWQPGTMLRLVTNPNWPGAAPATDKIQLRFYDSSPAMRAALERGAIDMIWFGMTEADQLALRDQNYRLFTGPAIFKSYLIFEHSQEPWDDARVRQAAALAVDREALANDVFAGTRLPLYSPVPDAVPGHVPAQPTRDLDQARALLNAAGYSSGNPLEITIWYLNDGRYTPLEEAYATAIGAQLEETGIFKVTLIGEPWETFRGQSAGCAYGAYLLGWPPSGSPARFNDPVDWMSYFITNTDSLCSNYSSETMDALLDSAGQASADPLRMDERMAIYAQMQVLWAEELPTLDLTQVPSAAIALSTIDNVLIDALGLMDYSKLTKAGA